MAADENATHHNTQVVQQHRYNTLQNVCGHELPANCRRTAGELPTNCRRTAGPSEIPNNEFVACPKPLNRAFPANCRRTAGELPANCRAIRTTPNRAFWSFQTIPNRAHQHPTFPQEYKKKQSETSKSCTFVFSNYPKSCISGKLPVNCRRTAGELPGNPKHPKSASCGFQHPQILHV